MQALSATQKIEKYLNSGKSFEQIANAFRIDVKVVGKVAERLGIKNPNSVIADDEVQDARDQAIGSITDQEVVDRKDEITDQIAKVRKQEIISYSPKELEKVLTRAESSLKMRQDNAHAQNILRKLMLYTFPEDKADFEKDDFIKMKLILDMQKQVKDMVIGDEPLTDKVITQAEKAVFAIPTQTFYGTGDEVLVDE